jgi:amino acid transporter/mannitol/fructose-specific phosphotransferase system IIA component (Ntr-type)
MPLILGKGSRLKKELGLFDVYVVATGATLSSGFFLLPGLAAAQAGAGVPLAYLVAALVLLPGILSKAELTTAMPRAGGIYYFLDRSMGPLVGTMGGFGTWIALTLKSAFALVGIGAYVGLFVPQLEVAPLAAACALVLGAVNMIGAKKSSVLQAYLVVALLILLVWYSGLGMTKVKLGNLTGLFASEGGSLLSTAGLVLVSYMGLTKIASVAEEVKDPDRNLPLGMFLAFGTAVLVYVVGTTVMVGVASAETLARDGGDLTPVATVADLLVGPWGAALMTVAAVLAFISVANAGILSASRYPLAMSRDHLLPRFLSRLTEKYTPVASILLTVAAVLVCVTLLDPTRIAKLAGAFKLLIFSLACLAVIVMRESRIESYDPGFRSPLYPWIQLLGIAAPFVLVVQMGFLAITFTVGLLVFGGIWYALYARQRVHRGGAFYHVLERLGQRRYEGLDRELRGILKEKGLRSDDRFDETVARAFVIDLECPETFERVAENAAEMLAHRVPGTPEAIKNDFLQGTLIGATPVTRGVALPHLRMVGLARTEMVMVRARNGVTIPPEAVHGHSKSHGEQVTALFFLVSPESDPARHLRMLAQIASRIDEEGFSEDWTHARNEQEMKEVLLHDESFLSIVIRDHGKTAGLIGRPLREIWMPEGSLVAAIHRGSDSFIPRGSTELRRNDRLTVIGDPAGIRALEGQYATD